MTLKRMIEAGKYDEFCFPGGYELLYFTADDSILCAATPVHICSYTRANYKTSRSNLGRPESS